MKDEHDSSTADILKFKGSGKKAFPGGYGVLDEQSYSRSYQDPPKELKRGMYGERFVPVSFVAKDWGVSTRRIRFLLFTGRLMGHQQDNGYWEVAYPYRYTFGVRGRSLKRQDRPSKRAVSKLE